MKSGWHWDCNIFFGSALRKQTCMTGILFIAVNMLKTKTRSFCVFIGHLIYFLLSCFVYGFENQHGKFSDLQRTLSLDLLLHFWLQNQNGKVLCRDKTFIPCSVAWFMASKTKTGSFYDLIRPLLLVFVYGFNFQQGKFL